MYLLRKFWTFHSDAKIFGRRRKTEKNFLSFEVANLSTRHEETLHVQETKNGVLEGGFLLSIFFCAIINVVSMFPTGLCDSVVVTTRHRRESVGPPIVKNWQRQVEIVFLK